MRAQRPPPPQPQPGRRKEEDVSVGSADAARPPRLWVRWSWSPREGLVAREPRFLTRGAGNLTGTPVRSALPKLPACVDPDSSGSVPARAWAAGRGRTWSRIPRGPVNSLGNMNKEAGALRRRLFHAKWASRRDTEAWNGGKAGEGGWAGGGQPRTLRRCVAPDEAAGR